MKKEKNYLPLIAMFLYLFNYSISQNRKMDGYNYNIDWVCDSSQQLVRMDLNSQMISLIETNVKFIHYAVYHQLLLKSDSTIFAKGNNVYGSLGDSTYTDKNYFVKVKGLNKITEISASEYLSAALNIYGEVYIWGKYALSISGNGYGNSNYPLKINGINNVVHISASKNKIFMLKQDSTVWYVDTTGAIKKINSLNKIVQIEALDFIPTVACLSKTGKVYVWGVNEYYQSTTTYGPMIVSGYYGNGMFGYTDTIPHLAYIDNVNKIFVGEKNFYAMKSDNTLWLWGGFIQNTACFNQYPYTVCNAQGSPYFRHAYVIPLIPTLRYISNATLLTYKDIEILYQDIPLSSTIYVLDNTNSLWKENCINKNSLSDTTFIQKEMIKIFSNPCAVVKVEEYSSIRHYLRLFPNPTSSSITIQTTQPTHSIQYISIKDLTGKTLFQQNIPSQPSVTLDISHLSNGLYFIEVQTNKGTFTEKVVVQQ